MKEHELRTIEPFYSQVESGIKNFEVRKMDRDFEVGDIIALRRFSREYQSDMPGLIRKKIIYILTHEQFPAGIMPGYCVLGLEEV